MKRFGLSQKERLNKGVEIKKVCDQGRKLVTPCFVLFYLKNDLPVGRLGVIASRKVGNHPQRNRGKRRIREAFRTHKPVLVPGFDLVFIARYQINKMAYDSFKNIFLDCLIKAGLLQNGKLFLRNS